MSLDRITAGEVRLDRITTGTLGVVLWHYTCAEAARMLGETGKLQPGAYGVVWLTDLAVVDREALGLTSRLLDCDRGEHRYRVTDTTGVKPWAEVRGLFRPALLEGLEHGTQPDRWWVSFDPVPVIRDDGEGER